MLETHEVEQARGIHTDAGDAYRIKCPECGDKIIVAESMWWVAECSCGYHWEVEIKAMGEKDD